MTIEWLGFKYWLHDGQKLAFKSSKLLESNFTVMMNDLQGYMEPEVHKLIKEVIKLNLKKSKYETVTRTAPVDLCVEIWMRNVLSESSLLVDIVRENELNYPNDSKEFERILDIKWTSLKVNIPKTIKQLKASKNGE